MSDSKKNLGKIFLDHLKSIGRAKKQAGRATTEELAAVAGCSAKDAYSRLYWMAKKDGVLEMTGSGKSAVWRTARKARPAKKAETTAAVEA